MKRLFDRGDTVIRKINGKNFRRYYVASVVSGQDVGNDIGNEQFPHEVILSPSEKEMRKETGLRHNNRPGDRVYQTRMFLTERILS